MVVTGGGAGLMVPPRPPPPGFGLGGTGVTTAGRPPGLGLGAVGLIALLVLRPATVADYNSLQTREGLAYEPEASEPFEGKAVSHHPNGQLMFKAEYRAGRQHGELISFFADGQKQSEGMLVDGSFHGKVIYYHPNGEVQSHYVYQNGEAISRKNWDAAGNMVIRGQ